MVAAKRKRVLYYFESLPHVTCLESLKTFHWWHRWNFNGSPPRLEGLCHWFHNSFPATFSCPVAINDLCHRSHCHNVIISAFLLVILPLPSPACGNNHPHHLSSTDHWSSPPLVSFPVLAAFIALCLIDMYFVCGEVATPCCCHHHHCHTDVASSWAFANCSNLPCHSSMITHLQHRSPRPWLVVDVPDLINDICWCLVVLIVIATGYSHCSSSHE